MTASPTWNCTSTPAPLKPTPTTRKASALAVYEPTSGYERLLAEAGRPVRRVYAHDIFPTARARGRPSRRVHPNKVRAYAQTCGQQAKTDRLDAQVLSRYGTAFDLAPDPSPETEDARLPS